MYIKTVLMNYLDYYSRTRQAGHTYAMINGLKESSNAILVFYTLDHGMRLKKSFNLNDCVVCYYRYPEEILGYYRPLVFDNAAIMMLFRESVNYMVELEKENKELKREVDRLKGDLDYANIQNRKF